MRIMAKRNHSAITSSGELSANIDSCHVGADYRPTKRRASRAGTRCVSTLSSAQLARKRSNDRDAQRAIRQRTKEHIEFLERRIDELTSTRHNDAALNEARLRNKLLEQELSNLKKSFTTSCSPVDHSAPWTMHGFYGSPLILDPETGDIIDSTSIHGPSSNPLPAIDGSPMTNYQIRDGKRDASRFGAYSNSDLASESSWISPAQSLSNSFLTSHPSAYQMPHILIANSPDSVCSSFALQSGIYGWQLSIKYLPPTTVFDDLLFGIIHRERANAVDGVNSHKHVNARKLVFCDDQMNTADDPISFILSDIINLSPLRRLPEKLACIYILHKFLRWQIFPRRDTYEEMPLWYTPRPSQLVQPHPIWVSTTFSPGLREKIINNQQLYCTDEFRFKFLLSLNVNWPYRDLDAVTWERGKLHVTPRFERHIRRLENWSFGRPFSNRYPELAEVCRFSDDQPDQTNAVTLF